MYKQTRHIAGHFGTGKFSQYNCKDTTQIFTRMEKSSKNPQVSLSELNSLEI